MLRTALLVVGGISLASGVFYALKQKTRMTGFSLIGAGALCVLFGLFVA
ncbi:MAG: hypothetical protein IKP95_06840 [Ruminococcus sp.]|nr:hypothetical protein [Ruminococcus sp.]